MTNRSATEDFMHDRLVERMSAINTFHQENAQAAIERLGSALAEAEVAFRERQLEVIDAIADATAKAIHHSVRGETGATDDHAIKAQAVRLEIAEEAYSKSVDEAAAQLKHSLTWSERERARLLAEDLANIDATMPRSPTAPGEPSGKPQKSKDDGSLRPFVSLPLIIFGGLVLIVIVEALN